MYSIRIKQDDPWRSCNINVYRVDGENYIAKSKLKVLLGIYDKSNDGTHITNHKTGQTFTVDVGDVYRNKKDIPLYRGNMGMLMPFSQFPALLQFKFNMTKKDAAAAYARFEKQVTKAIEKAGEKEEEDDEDAESIPSISSDSSSSKSNRRTSPPRKREREDLEVRVDQMDATLKDMSFSVYCDSAEFQERVRAEVVRQALCIRDEMRAGIEKRPDLIEADLNAFRERRQREIEAELRDDADTRTRIEAELRAEIFRTQSLVDRFTEELRGSIMTDEARIKPLEAQLREKIRTQVTAASYLEDPIFMQMMRKRE